MLSDGQTGTLSKPLNTLSNRLYMKGKAPWITGATPSPGITVVCLSAQLDFARRVVKCWQLLLTRVSISERDHFPVSTGTRLDNSDTFRTTMSTYRCYIPFFLFVPLSGWIVPKNVTVPRSLGRPWMECRCVYLCQKFDRPTPPIRCPPSAVLACLVHNDRISSRHVCSLPPLSLPLSPRPWVSSTLSFFLPSLSSRLLQHPPINGTAVPSTRSAVFAISYFPCSPQGYQLVTDRFALADGSGPACNTGDRKYCGGTYKGIINHLDYIQNMGFDAIWISPVVSTFQGASAYGEAYHGLVFSTFTVARLPDKSLTVLVPGTGHRTSFLSTTTLARATT